MSTEQMVALTRLATTRDLMVALHVHYCPSFDQKHGFCGALLK
jgi:hypothetical protein